jgi:hypothetical protein
MDLFRRDAKEISGSAGGSDLAGFCHGFQRHPTFMAAPEPDPTQQGDGKSRIMVLVLLGIVVAFIAAFVILRPSPSGTGHPTSTSSHAPASQ